MQENPKGNRLDPSTNLAQDMQDQGRVLAHVLTLHPTHLTIPELVRELAADAEDFASTDAVERAIRDLTGAGLLHCPGGVVMPTRAALRFDAISECGV